MAQDKLQKLELTWIGKDEVQEAIEPRILIEDPKYSYGDTGSGNMLIHGDNLLALKALEHNYSNTIKCIYIDPPFNTGQAFELYDDNIKHSLWLSLMQKRLIILHKLLCRSGLFWIHLDDIEVHYCKVMLDEIFGRENFLSHITYERSAVAGLGQGGYLVNTTEHILLYKKEILPITQNYTFFGLEMNIMKRYNRYIADFGEKKLVREFISKSNNMPVKVYEHDNINIQSISLKDYEKRNEEINSIYVQHINTIFRGNRVQKENAFQNDLIQSMDKTKLYSVEYTPSRGKYENIQTTLYYYNCELLSWLSDTAEVKEGTVVKSQKMSTLWKHNEIPKADIANEGGVYFPRGKKPEQLIKRILEMSTNEGDIILDSFLGSGTTAAVAQKMNRRYIGIELGNQAYTHCYLRLRNVTDGKDLTGISKAQNWKGGSGFKFYELAPSLLKEDKFGNLVINKEYNADMLAAAMAKQEGYTYQPDSTLYWKQGQSSEHDYIYTTTQFLTVESLDAISETMQEGESLLICCTAFQKECQNHAPNITVKKIPQLLLGRCEFDKDDYSLNIINMPPLDLEEYLDDFPEEEPTTEAKDNKPEEGTLFD